MPTYAPVSIETRRRQNQNDTLDAIASGELDTPSGRRVQGSLKPSPAMMFAAATGNAKACAIRDSWRPTFNVVVMDSQELDALMERCHVTFHGSAVEND